MWSFDDGTTDAIMRADTLGRYQDHEIGIGPASSPATRHANS